MYCIGRKKHPVKSANMDREGGGGGGADLDKGFHRVTAGELLNKVQIA